MEVTTVRGNIALRENCRKIKGAFYEINKECFLVNGRWNRYDNGKITKDYTTNVYVSKEIAENNMRFGIVDVEHNIPIAGYYSNKTCDLEVFVKLTITNSVPSIYTGDNRAIKGELPTRVIQHLQQSRVATLPCISEEVLNKLGNHDLSYTEDYAYPTIPAFKQKFEVGLGRGYGGLQYGCDLSLTSASRDHANFYKYPITAEHGNIARLLNGHSFGLEFETRDGYLSRILTRNLGIIPVKDGSLRLPNGKEPYEFVTIPLQGAKGVSTLDNTCKVLTERTTFDNRCSLHLHMGNVPYDELFIISFIKLIGMVQNELLNIFPQYKTDYKLMGGEKNYCKLLPKNILPKTFKGMNKLNKDEYEEFISSNFNPIYEFVSGGYTPDRRYNRKIISHPTEKPKWHIESRYYIVNLVPLMFKNFRTIEWRLHTPTTNRYKVFNWLLICSALAKYAETHQTEIIENDSITLKHVLDTMFSPEISARLNYYIDKRKAQFSGGKDSLGLIEFDTDSKYTEQMYEK